MGTDKKGARPCAGVEVDTPVIWVHGKCLIHNQMMNGCGSDVHSVQKERGGECCGMGRRQVV